MNNENIELFDENIEPPNQNIAPDDKSNEPSDDIKICVPPMSPAPFTQDGTLVRKISNTTYILTAKYKQGAKEGLTDKLLRLIENNTNDY